MKKNFILVIIFCSLGLSSCQNKTGAGTAMGAVAGGIIGSTLGKGSGQFVGVGVGALAGALIGNQIGSALDEQDKAKMAHSSQRALEHAPAGQPVEWKNPDSGHFGYTTPTRTYNNDKGRYCREFTQVVVIGGEEKKAYGKACRQPDGQWEIVSNDSSY